MSTCRSCDAPILWVTMESGKAMPLDADPHPDGTVLPAQVPTARAQVIKPENMAEIKSLGLGLHRSHFATCPNAAKHRR